MRGFHLSRASSRGTLRPPKDVILPLLALLVRKRLQIDRHAAYHNKDWWLALYICQHRWPWTTLNPLQKRGLYWLFYNFWLQYTFQQWIATKWLERPRQPAYEFFWHRTSTFINLNFDLLNSSSLPCGDLKFGYSFKMHYILLHAVHDCPGGRTAAIARHTSFAQITCFV